MSADIDTDCLVTQTCHNIATILSQYPNIGTVHNIQLKMFLSNVYSVGLAVQQVIMLLIKGVKAKMH